MKATLLGSGGNTPTPLPTCQCRVCTKAREEGGKHVRRGNSTYVHDAKAMVDTPELAFETLNEEKISEVDAVLLSHFHPDHTLGLRVLQGIGLSDIPIESWVESETDVYMPRETHQKLVENSSILGHLLGEWANVNVVEHGDVFEINDVEVEAIGWREEPGNQERNIFGYLFEQDGDRVLVSPDENKNMPTDGLGHLHLWIKECGLFERTPSGTRIRSRKRLEKDLQTEMTFSESVEQVTEVDVDKVVLTEIEELYRRTPSEYLSIAEKKSQPVTFGHDGQTLET
nr:MAG: metal-dependent hydrolases of the beta-lactamase superfamily I [Candidatus Nanosalinarum sp. J07AB56]